MSEFFVPGKPVGQGNIKMSPHGRGYHANAKDLIPWRQMVAIYARNAKVPLIEGGVALSLQFVLARPKTVTRDRPTTAPDLDHYVRAIGDALKGIAYKDDSQIVALSASKHYGDTPGVHIMISDLT